MAKFGGRGGGRHTNTACGATAALRCGVLPLARTLPDDASDSTASSFARSDDTWSTRPSTRLPATSRCWSALAVSASTACLTVSRNVCTSWIDTAIDRDVVSSAVRSVAIAAALSEAAVFAALMAAACVSSAGCVVPRHGSGMAREPYG